MPIQKIKPVTPRYAFERYSHIISPLNEEDGGGYVMTLPDLPGVMGDGATEAQAVADGKEAFAAAVAALQDMGREVPEPLFSIQDIGTTSASGKFVARVPKSLHAQLAHRAKKEGVSLNTLVLTFIAQGMGLQRI